jgi:hypothetical protein
MTTMEVFNAVAAGKMTAEQGANLLMNQRDERDPMTAIWNFLKKLNRSKIVNGIGAFFALAIPVLVVIGQNLPAGWKVTILIAGLVGVLTRAQYIFQKVIPLLDGSSVVQIKPPSISGAQPSLVSVAVDPTDLPKGAAKVVSL